MLGGAILGGTYAIDAEGPFRVPVFTFRARDLAAVRALLAHQEATCEVRFVPGDTSRLAYTLVLPDLPLAPAWIAIEPKDMLHVASGALIRNESITTRIVDESGSVLSLDDRTFRLYLDWVGDYAAARHAFDLAMVSSESGERAGQLDRARRLVRHHLADLESSVVAAHELLGAILEQLGEIGGSHDAFLKAIEKGRLSPAAGETTLHSRAASPL